ncbi:hypothetical protein DH09_10140 [Bacillaceae bacterium JMAK1]|nr:hypothetical protein DH09_10140 [Bacillaceae bacterium JMAK1]
MTTINNITIIEQSILNKLIELINNDIYVTYYSDLAKSINNKEVTSHTIGVHLNRISRSCNELGLPLISAMVINKERHRPGAGFYALYKEVYSSSETSKDHIFIEEISKIKKTKCWSKFTN